MEHERLIHHSVQRPRQQQSLESTPFHRYVFDDGTVWTEFYRHRDGYLLRFPGLADFEVSADGKTVTAHPVEDGDPATVEHLYINQLVPLAMSRQGYPAFHASVVTVASGAVAFLGGTGMGKSTLAASFALNGATFLTDDALLVEERADTCMALPSHASVRLWEDSVGALTGDTIPQADTLRYTDKARLLAGDALAFCEQPQPLLAAYVLKDNDVSKPVIEPLSGSDRTMEWVENSFLLDIEDRDLLARHFDWTHRISSSVPGFTLDYPRNYGMLADVRDAVCAHVATL
jgi:hypothetical protein